MSIRKDLLALIASCLGALIFGSALADNCAHDNGGWTDDYFYYWYLSGNAGTVYVPCARDGSYIPWYVSGTMSNGTAHLTATDPYYGGWGYEDCGESFTYDATVYPGGCNTADGTWHSVPANATGFLDMGKQCDVPAVEVTDPDLYGWSSSSSGVVDNLGPYFVFKATINNGNDGNLGGRTIREVDVDGQQGVDGCFQTGYPGDLEFTHVTGNSSGLTTANVYGDAVGYGNYNIAYYRAHSSLPCSAHLYQQIQIYCGASPNYTYGNVKQNEMFSEVTSQTLIKVTRANKPHSRTYTWPY